MSINTNYMKNIKYVLATAFFAVAMAFISTPTVTLAGTGNGVGGVDDFSGDTGNYDVTSDWSSFDTGSTNWDVVSDTSSFDNYYAAPSFDSGCSSCGGSYSTPSYTSGCMGCGTSSAMPSYTSGCLGCGSYSTPTYSSGLISAPSIPTYTYGVSSSNSNANPIVTNTNTSNSTGGSASTSVSSVNNLVNNSPSTATNNSTTTVNVVNNIVVNVPQSGYTGPYVPPTTYNNDLIVSCSINPTYNVQIGQDVSFFANASGGNGNYSYSWTGSDGLNSSSQSFTGRFYSAGSKYATVTVYSGGQSRSQTCNTNVGGTYNGNLSAYCTATPSVANTNQSVNWTVYPTGGNGAYSYYWTGSDGLSGYNSSISQVYGSTGQKTATVTVTSNGQSITASCNANINAIYGYQTQASNVTLIKGTSDQVGQVAGVYLDQVPATGISLSMKAILFVIGLLMWSLFAAFIFSKRKKVSGVNTNAIADFKARMIAMKNR